MMQKPFSKLGKRKHRQAIRRPLGLACVPLVALAALGARADDTNLVNEVRLLREENSLLKNQMQSQNGTLDRLTMKVEQLETQVTAREIAAGENPPAKSGMNLGRVNLSAEGGVAFFNTGSDGSAPHGDFRVDEARLFVEAPIWDNVYFFSGIELATREHNDLSAHLGELYLDFEDVSQLWGKDGQLNIRAGRMQIPFGEEYVNRYAMENPLISHSLTDFWGIDPGVELYGTLGKFSYAVAVQNGGGTGVHDFDGDKSVAGRVSFDPNKTWHFSVSGLHTGEVAMDDWWSAIWFGNGWFRNIGSPAATKFRVDAVEGDITARWKSGHVSAFGGYAHYTDNDPMMSHERDIYFYSAEVEQNLPHKFYAAARFSQIFAPNGYPIVGFGEFDDYYFETLTTELWRLSLGIGYRFSDRLTLKAEYSFEHGKEVGGDSRDNEDFFGTEAAFKF